MLYLVLKWWHLVAMVSWMAGVLYLIRLLVYHRLSYGKNPDNHKLLTVMEKRLSLYIMRPAMAVTWLTGLAMAGLNHGVASAPWFWAKLSCVIALSFASELACGYSKKIRQNKQLLHTLPSARFFRIYNEVPTLLMIIIIALVLFRP